MTAKKTQAKRAGAKKGASKRSTERQAEGPKSTRTGPVETDAGALVPKGAAMGEDSATGQALREDTKEVPKGEDRGSTREIAGGDAIKPDIELPKPVGAQAEPAQFTKNGSIEHGMVPSPSGPVPVAAVTATQEEADKRLEEHQKLVKSQFKNTVTKLTDAQIGHMSRAELNAVAHDRGYDLQPGGSRVTRTAFKRAQDKDKFAVEAKA